MRTRSYEWGGTAYGTKRDALCAMATDWLAADGQSLGENPKARAALKKPYKLAYEILRVEGFDKLRVAGERDDDGEPIVVHILVSELAEVLGQLADELGV